MSDSSDDVRLGARTLQELLRELRHGYVLRQPVLVQLDVGDGDISGAERTRSVRLPRVPDGDLPEELARCRFVIVGRARASEAGAPITVGRARTCDVVVDDASVSKLHATISHDRERDQYTVVDEGSRNGTHVDGAVVEPGGRLLYAGAKLSFGDATFVFLDPPTLRKLARLAP